MVIEDKYLHTFPSWVKTRVKALEYKCNDLCNWYLEEFIDNNKHEKCMFKAWYLTTDSLISLCLSFDQIIMIEYFKKDIVRIETILDVLQGKCSDKDIVCVYSIKIKCLNGDIIQLEQPNTKRTDQNKLFSEFIEAFRQHF